MEWSQVLTILLGVFVMFLWGQRESRSEVRAIRAEVKDFHGRLCTIEEKYYQMDRRK